MSNYRGRIESLARKILQPNAQKVFVVVAKPNQAHVSSDRLMPSDDRARYRPDRDLIIRVECQDGPADPIAELERILSGEGVETLG